MRVKTEPKKLNPRAQETESKKRKCRICYENLEELQSFHLDHRLHLACRECIKHYLDSLAGAVVIRCPYCRLPVDSILYI